MRGNDTRVQRCLGTGCDGVLWTQRRMAEGSDQWGLLGGIDEQKDDAGRQYLVCPKCRGRNYFGTQPGGVGEGARRYVTTFEPGL
jgi:hypothetical protein